MRCSRLYVINMLEMITKTKKHKLCHFNLTQYTEGRNFIDLTYFSDSRIHTPVPLPAARVLKCVRGNEALFKK